MKTIPRAFLVVLLLSVGLSLSAHAQRGGGGGTSATCRPADERVNYTLVALKNMVTATKPSVISARQAIALPAVDSSQVTHVTDNSICAKAEKAYTAALTTGSVPSSLQVYVFKVGNVYQVWDPSQRHGEFTTTMTLSGSYKVLSKYSL